MRRGCLFLFVVTSALQLASAGDPDVVHNVQGIVGGSVNMRCVLEHSQNIYGLYFQKTPANGNVEQDIFINGFHYKELPVRSEYKNRTIVNKTEFSMEMLDLSPADEGEYTCIPLSSSGTYIKTKFLLTVTANYSVPIITVQGCGNDPGTHNCVIGCSSSGGYPLSNVTWGVAGEEMSSLLRDEGDPVFTQDAHSYLWNVSHVVTLNCSRLLNVTCSVGGVVSHAVSVCQPSPPTDFTIPFACATLLLVPIVFIVIAVILWRRIQPSAERSTDAELASLNSGQAG